MDEHPLQDTDYDVIEFKGPLIVAGKGESTEEGKPSVILALEVGEDEFLIKETTLSLFLDAADTLKSKYGDPR